MINRENYLLVNEYLLYLSEICQVSPSSVKRYRSYLRHLIMWADETPLSMAVDLRPTFSSYVSTLETGRKNTGLAAATQKKVVESTRRFFQWSKTVHFEQFGNIPATWIESLRPPRLPQAPDEHIYVKLEQAIQLAGLEIPENDLALRRDQAAAIMLYLSGMRATAFTTLPIEAVDVTHRSIRQWPELGTKTKNGKRATTFLLPIPELISVVENWDHLVRLNLPFTARWYAPIENQWGEQKLSLASPGDNRGIALNKRLRCLFRATGMPYMSAHKFRHGHAVYGLQHAQTMADYKAVSMNLMHEDIKITDQIYARILTEEVARRIAGLTDQQPSASGNSLLKDIDTWTTQQLVQLMTAAVERLKS